MSERYKKIVNLCHGKLDMALGQSLNLDLDIRKKCRIHQIVARILSKKMNVVIHTKSTNSVSLKNRSFVVTKNS